MTEHRHELDHSSCESLLGSLSDYVDGALSEDLCQMIRAHMDGCENCRVVVDTLTKTVHLYHGPGRDVALPDPVQERLFRVLRLNGCLDPEERSSDASLA